LTPGRRVYGEKLIEIHGVEYRIWNPYRSKLAAGILNGLRELPIAVDSRVLYLGAASGTTVSHVSDIATGGVVYCVEFSKRAFVDLLRTCEKRKNTIPILADATKPEEYSYLLEEVDVIYQDIAQPNQSEILIRNSDYFLKNGGRALIALKARSIDFSEDPQKIFRREVKKLERTFRVRERIDLNPYEKDHLLLLLSK
jgi:fibrillarin-like pre-rRNA processing protein